MNSRVIMLTHAITYISRWGVRGAHDAGKPFCQTAHEGKNETFYRGKPVFNSPFWRSHCRRYALGVMPVRRLKATLRYSG